MKTILTSIVFVFGGNGLVFGEAAMAGRQVVAQEREGLTGRVDGKGVG
ncbi:MAG: hypothetical protein AAGD22_07630 [Verrucomicrobiota bacterium]